MKLKDMKTGQTISCYLAVKKCEVRQTNTTPPKDYLDLTLSDGESEIVARVWEHSGPAPAVNNVIYVSASLTQYRGENQLKIKEWRNANTTEYNPTDFLPVTPRNLNDMRAQLEDYIRKVTDPGLAQILHEVFNIYYDDYIASPAALKHHHGYLGGLLEHSCGVVDHCLRQATADTDIDLLITGATLHDIGKCLDYNWKNSCVITMSDTGQLLGHITQGVMIISAQAPNCPDLTAEKLHLLLHLIASHHGKLEYGSPVEPCTREAIILHNADMLDMQMWKIAQAQAQVPEGEKWTGWVSGLNRKFWVGGKNER